MSTTSSYTGRSRSSSGGWAVANGDGDVRMRAESPGPATPPEALDIDVSPYGAASAYDGNVPDGQDLSPVRKTTEADRMVDVELSGKLEDAMTSHMSAAATTTATARVTLQAQSASSSQSPLTASNASSRSLSASPMSGTQASLT